MYVYQSPDKQLGDIWADLPFPFTIELIVTLSSPF